MSRSLRRRLLDGGTCVNAWLMLPSALSAEMIARQPWDSITVDMQHGAHDYHTLLACFQAMHLRGPALLARVPSNDFATIGKVLDAGAAGIICPLVNTREDAERLADACRYPPAGSRSNGPLRPALYAEAPGAYQAGANKEVLVLAMVETRQGVDNAREILAVPGIDGIYVGPSDLRFSLGLPPVLDANEPEILEIYARLVEEARRAGKFAAMHCASSAYAVSMLRAGFRFVTAGSDVGWLTRGGMETVSAVQRHIAQG